MGSAGDWSDGNEPGGKGRLPIVQSKKCWKASLGESGYSLTI